MKDINLEPRTRIPAAKPLDLADSVEYSADSVVSRTLIENKAGTITLFAFDAGQGLSEHSAPFDAVVLVLDGEVELTIGGENVNATSGQMVVMPANVPHALQAKQQFKMLLTMLRA
ncbi:MAG: cupin domain-containing protein [ANME-2 cluster archaeon]|nr:cupin domain-containing protein [ANME-2 cluster archaeon]MCL7474646.1 cupin domain-containing protein [ANME-2 cluster archaeon]MDF1531043.1 cupin domain-containing protein [ANME-2 cluster archaeon]